MRGGKREGAGRKTGSKTKRSSEVALAAAAQGISPVEVMLEVMRSAYSAGDAGMALDAAKSAAPYVSPRLSAIAIDMKDLNEEDLRRLAAD